MGTCRRRFRRDFFSNRRFFNEIVAYISKIALSCSEQNLIGKR